MEQINTQTSIKVVYNPFDLEKYSGKLKVIHSPLRIFYIGRYSANKNLLLWLDVAEKIHREIGNTVFKIVGDGELRAIIGKKISEKDLSGIIKLTGFVPNADKIYQDHDLLLFLSRYESFGNVAVESILSNTPVIVSDIPAMQEIFKNYPDFIVSLTDDLAGNVINKIKNYEYLKMLTEKACVEFRNRFNKN